MRLAVEPMKLEDIPQVLEVDRESYTLPWPASAYRREILHNRSARYLVLRRVVHEGEANAHDEEDQRPRLPLPFFRWPRSGDARHGRQNSITGYAGMWLMVDEAHITTIAMREEWRGHGFGELLLASLIEAATEMGAQRITLEVRVSNDAAQNLYRKYGFTQEGVRRRYYSDNNEDAYIMTTDNVQSLEYRETFSGLVDRLYRRLEKESEAPVTAPAFSHAQPGGD
ncbi:MAG: ribosomal protein S18-alanine N-acetyltransferase [Chloroflexota bacterium]